MHEQVAEAICKLIARSYKPGETLPPYRELARRFGVGDVTVRKALRLLAERGIVNPIRSRGTVVNRRLDPGEIRLASLGLVIPGMINRMFRQRYMSEIASEIFRVIDNLPNADARIFPLRYRSPDSPGAPRAVVDAGVGGLILLGVPDNDLIAEYAALELPTVVVDQLAPDIPLDFVVVDNFAAAATAAEHLAAMGHRRVAYYDKPPSNITDGTGRFPVGQESDILERRQGFLEAARHHGMEVVKAAFESKSGRSRLEARAALIELVRNHPDRVPTAIATNDESLALALIRDLLAAGVRVPKDVSVIALAGTEELLEDGRLLTICRTDFRAMGRVAMELLQQRRLSSRPTAQNVVRIGFEYRPGHTIAPPRRA